MTSNPYQVNRDIERIVNEIMPQGCHVLKTNQYIGCWVYCTEDELGQHEEEIDGALMEYREKYTVFVMTEGSNSR